MAADLHILNSLSPFENILSRSLLHYARESSGLRRTRPIRCWQKWRRGRLKKHRARKERVLTRVAANRPFGKFSGHLRNTPTIPHVSETCNSADYQKKDALNL